MAKRNLLIDPPAKMKGEAWELGLLDGREGRSNGNPYHRFREGMSEGVRLILSAIYEQAYAQGWRQHGEANRS